jgi:putative RecB family exonuclease
MVCGRRGVFRPGTPVFAVRRHPWRPTPPDREGSLSVAARKVWGMETSTEGAVQPDSSPAAAADSPVPPGTEAAARETAVQSGPTAIAPATLSPSRASDFMQCPLLYRFRVIDRLPEKPSEAATRGTLVHAVLERLFDAPEIGRAHV